MQLVYGSERIVKVTLCLYYSGQSQQALHKQAMLCVPFFNQEYTVPWQARQKQADYARRCLKDLR